MPRAKRLKCIDLGSGSPIIIHMINHGWDAHHKAYITEFQNREIQGSLMNYFECPQKDPYQCPTPDLRLQCDLLKLETRWNLALVD